MEGAMEGVSGLVKVLLRLVCGARHRVLQKVGRACPTIHLLQVRNPGSV